MLEHSYVCLWCIVFLDGLGLAGLVFHLQSPELSVVFWSTYFSALASVPTSLSRVHQQPPRLEKRSARDTAIDVQSQPHAGKCKCKMNNREVPCKYLSSELSWKTKASKGIHFRCAYIQSKVCLNPTHNRTIGARGSHINPSASKYSLKLGWSFGSSHNFVQEEGDIFLICNMTSSSPPNKW